MKVFAAVLVVGGCVFFAGCSRSVEATFVNTTSRPVELHVYGPGEGVGYLGELQPDGQVRTVLRPVRANLPTTYTYTAGPYRGAFSMTKDSAESIRVMIPQGPGRDPAWEGR